MDIPELDRQGLRHFAFTFGGVVAVLFGIAFPWLFNYGFPWWPWAVCVVFVIWGLVVPKSLAPVYRLWMRIGHVLNAIMSRVILGIVFYVLVFPTGLILRLRGRDPMHRKFEKDRKTYRVRSRQWPPDQMQKPF